jgi:hypothetical protein
VTLVEEEEEEEEEKHVKTRGDDGGSLTSVECLF